MLFRSVIFPLVFANGLNPSEGPGLVFDTLPLAFGQMPGGVFFATIFFVLLSFAAWTSALGVMEPAVAWLVEHDNRTRVQAAAMVGGVTWLVGWGTVLSFNVLRDFTFFKGTIYNNIDYVTTNVMLPLGGMFVTVCSLGNVSQLQRRRTGRRQRDLQIVALSRSLCSAGGDRIHIPACGWRFGIVAAPASNAGLASCSGA